MNIAIFDREQVAPHYLAEILVAAGYQCRIFTDSEVMFAHMNSVSYDLLILDREVSEAGRKGILERARSFLSPLLPILYVTNRLEEDDIVKLLSAGADACITKPVNRAELICRVSAMLRRMSALKSKATCPRFGFYLFDTALKKIYFREKCINTTPKEFDLALTFFNNPNIPMSHKYLYFRVWDHAISISSRTLKIHISRIRKKLELQEDKDYWIKSFYGGGYVLIQKNPTSSNNESLDSNLMWYRSSVTSL